MKKRPTPNLRERRRRPARVSEKRRPCPCPVGGSELATRTSTTNPRAGGRAASHELSSPRRVSGIYWFNRVICAASRRDTGGKAMAFTTLGGCGAASSVRLAPPQVSGGDAFFSTCVSTALIVRAALLSPWLGAGQSTLAWVAPPAAASPLFASLPPRS